MARDKHTETKHRDAERTTRRTSRTAVRSAALLLIGLGVLARVESQTIESNPGHYYEHRLQQHVQACPLPYVRESDVVWEHIIWRTIDMREKFNHFFYYPLEAKGSEGYKNFAYMIWDAVVGNEIQIFADDELKIPLDNEAFVEMLTKPDTVILEIVDDEENYEYKSVLIPKEFNSEEVLQIRLKEAWYIEKQNTEQAVRPLSLCLTKELYKEHDGDIDYIGTAELFWIPMQAMQTRNLFARRKAFNADNMASLPSWENVFLTRRFNSYITRETNVYNRMITDYLTGSDAIWESERIESMLLDISQDMWEY